METAIEEEADAAREDVTERCEEPPSLKESSAAPPPASDTPAALNNNLPHPEHPAESDPSQLSAEVSFQCCP